MKLTSHYFARHMEGQNGTSTQNFDLIFESDFDIVFSYICLEIYLCILNSGCYVMYRISLHSMWQIT